MKRVVLVTGSSRGLGRAFAECIATDGAQVVVNSTTSGGEGAAVAEAISAEGGDALHIPGKVEDAQALVDTVVERCGRIDAIVHNAGFVQDKTLKKMTSEQWQAVLGVHLTASFELTQAAWPHFEAAGGGRLVFISSASGLYGNFGQGNYAAAKAGMYGLARTIAMEGGRADIRANCVAPYGATTMNSANLDEAFKARIKPAFIAPLVGYLVRPECQETGGLFEASAGAFKKVRWERTQGLRLAEPMSIDQVAEGWDALTDFSQTEHPQDMRESLGWMVDPPG